MRNEKKLLNNMLDPYPHILYFMFTLKIIPNSGEKKKHNQKSRSLFNKKFIYVLYVCSLYKMILKKYYLYREEKMKDQRVLNIMKKNY